MGKNQSNHFISWNVKFYIYKIRHYDSSFEWVKMYTFIQRQKTFHFDVLFNERVHHSIWTTCLALCCLFSASAVSASSPCPSQRTIASAFCSVEDRAIPCRPSIYDNSISK